MKLTNNEKRKYVRDDYDAIAEIYANEDRNIELYKTYIDKFIKSLKGEGYVLDVGCAAGQFSNYLQTNGLNVVGIDFSKNLLNIAKKKFKNINFIHADICDWRTEQKFDGIFTKDTLFHLPDENLESVIEKFYNILNDDGKMLIILDIPKTAGEEIYDEPLDTRYKLYYNYLTMEKIKNILLNHNFKVNKIEYINDKDNLYVYASGIMVLYVSK